MYLKTQNMKDGMAFFLSREERDRYKSWNKQGWKDLYNLESKPP